MATIHLMRTFKITLTRRNFTPNSNMYYKRDNDNNNFRNKNNETTSTHSHSHTLITGHKQIKIYHNFIMRYNNTAHCFHNNKRHTGRTIYLYIKIQTMKYHQNITINQVAKITQVQTEQLNYGGKKHFTGKSMSLMCTWSSYYRFMHINSLCGRRKCEKKDDKMHNKYY